VRGSRIQTLSGGEIGNVGMNVAKTAAPLSTRNGFQPAAKGENVRLVKSLQHRMPFAGYSRFASGFRPVDRERSSGVKPQISVLGFPKSNAAWPGQWAQAGRR